MQSPFHYKARCAAGDMGALPHGVKAPIRCRVSPTYRNSAVAIILNLKRELQRPWLDRAIEFDRRSPSRLQFKSAQAALGKMPFALERAIAMSSGCHTSARTAAPHEAGGLHNSMKWYALAVKPRHEKSVHRMLEIKEQETFLPVYERRHRYAHREKVFHLPWFPGYIFCRFNLGMCRPIVTTPGVIRVLGSGSEATPIEDSEITSLQLAVKSQTAVEPWPFLQTGEKVQITQGALAGVEGILTQVKQAPRIVLSVSLLQRSVLLEIDREIVARSVPNGFSGK